VKIKQEHSSVSLEKIKDAIAHRDLDFILTAFFHGKPPKLKDAFRLESECWDFKAGCPGHGEQVAWAEIAADVLAFYNTHGGILFFGIADKTYSFCGTKTAFDSKLFNDKIRRYCGDKFFVHYGRPFLEPSGRYLGVAIVPKRGLQVVPFFADAPMKNGEHYFKAGDIAIRRNDETMILRGDSATEYLRQFRIPNSNAQFLVNESSYRIIRPDWDDFVPRDSLCESVMEGLQDERTFVTSLTGIGGAGKTALACWGVLQAYQKYWFDFIVSISAKDRALTSGGIQEVPATGSTLEHLLNSILDTIGCSDFLTLPLNERLKEVNSLIKGCEMLLFVDNLETVIDEALIKFLDNLPMPVKAILTSRKTRVRKAVFPIEVGPLEQKEAMTFLDLIAAKKGRDFIPDMNRRERQLIIESCFSIPLVIEWFVGVVKDAPTAIEFARQLELSPKQSEEVLEFSFRRVHEQLEFDARKVLKALSLFSDPQPIEALSAACKMRLDAINLALDDLLDASLVIKVFDQQLNDTTFGMLPITRRFAYAELGKESGLEQSLRNAMSVYYQGSDITDPVKRKAMVAIREGKRDVDTLLVDAAKEMRNEGKLNEAEDLLMQAVQRNPSSWRAARELGDFYKHDKKTTFALDYYAKAAQLAPKRGKDRALIFREYGILLRDAATPDALQKAGEALEVALQETPNDPVCLFVLGQVLCRRQMFAKAMPLLEKLANSGDLKSRQNAYPLLKKCYETSRDMLKLAQLKEEATKDGIQLG